MLKSSHITHVENESSNSASLRFFISGMNTYSSPEVLLETPDSFFGFNPVIIWSTGVKKEK